MEICYIVLVMLAPWNSTPKTEHKLNEFQILLPLLQSTKNFSLAYQIQRASLRCGVDPEKGTWRGPEFGVSVEQTLQWSSNWLVSGFRGRQPILGEAVKDNAKW